MVVTDTRREDDPAAEILATSGLLTLLGSVLATVIAVVSLWQGDVAWAGVLGAVAATSFVVSLACFFSDSNRSEDTPLPFPSWLRTDAEPAPELSAASWARGQLTIAGSTSVLPAR